MAHKSRTGGATFAAHTDGGEERWVRAVGAAMFNHIEAGTERRKLPTSGNNIKQSDH